MKWTFVALIFAAAGCGPSGGQFHPPHYDLGVHIDSGATCLNPPKDTDGDGISDADEGAPSRDTDHDGIPDYQDPDSDNDGIPDIVEGRTGGACFPPVDSDGDGKPDYVDLDSDSATDSTVPDSAEAGADPVNPVDTNHDGRPDYMDPDDDGDGIPDVVELTPQGGSIAATTLALAPDTDGDGTPDFLDTDSDGDNIADAFEGNVDTDMDGIPNFRDLDSDGDCISDANESGVTVIGQQPVDTDGDGAPDFLDLDSDGEGLLDHLEDANCNGIVDPCETDRLKPDTDGDGVNDLIEYEDCAVKTPQQQTQLMCTCWGADAANGPLQAGDFVFIVDYMKPPSPSSETLNLSTNVSQADVVFALDTTGSMQGSLNKLASDIAATVIPQSQAKVSNIAFGAIDFKDFGDPYVVQYDYRITTVKTNAGVTAVQNAFNAIKTAPCPAYPGISGACGGGDSPEANLLALYSIAGGPQINILGASAPTAWNSQYNLASIPPTTLPPGETQGNQGNVGWRAGSVPIVMVSTDADWHDAWNAPVSGENGVSDYADDTFDTCKPSTYAGCKLTPSRATVVQYMKAINAHVMYLAGTGGGASGNPKAHGAALAVDTGAVVNVADFGSGAARPANCSPTQCCTGLNGVGESDSPVGSGNCPLSFTFDDSTGTGISGAVVSGIVALANGLKFDIHVEAVDVDPMTVENFMLELVPNLSGMGPAAVCITTPPAPLQDNFTGPFATPGSDGTLDTFPGISGGKQICFDVVPKMNTTVMETNQPQFFRAQLNVKGVANGATVNLGTPRDVFFLVPPMIVNGQIP